MLTEGTYTIKAELIDKAGKTQATSFATYTKTPVEEWRAHPVAMDALKADWVPAPWTPVTIKSHVGNVWGRTYDYNHGIFRQIFSQGVPLLASPAVLKYRIAGETLIRELRQKNIKSNILGKGRVQVIQDFADNNFKLSLKQTLEFDGFNLSEFSLNPVKPLDLDMIWVEYPLQNMRFMVINSREYYGKICSEKFYSFDSIWIGTDKISCRFIAENCKGWYVDSRKPRVAIEHGQGVSRIKMLVSSQI